MLGLKFILMVECKQEIKRKLTFLFIIFLLITLGCQSYSPLRMHENAMQPIKPAYHRYQQ